MSKALSHCICAMVFLGIALLASHLHYAAGYDVNELTIWALPAVVGVTGALGYAIFAIAAFVDGK